jgi:hypothetical protein
MLALLISATSSYAAGAQITPNTGDPSLIRESYYEAIVCFIANGHAKGLRERAGGAKKAAIYEKQAHEAFVVASTAGQQLGFTNDRIEAEFASIQKTELPLMVKDDAYFFREVARCKAFGLM